MLYELVICADYLSQVLLLRVPELFLVEPASYAWQGNDPYALLAALYLRQSRDRYRIYDQLSREIYDYAVKTTIDVVDGNEINFDLESLLNALHPDFCTLSYSAMEILFAKQLESGIQSGPINVFGVFPKFV